MIGPLANAVLKADSLLYMFISIFPLCLYITQTKRISFFYFSKQALNISFRVEPDNFPCYFVNSASYLQLTVWRVVLIIVRFARGYQRVRGDFHTFLTVHMNYLQLFNFKMFSNGTERNR